MLFLYDKRSINVIVVITVFIFLITINFRDGVQGIVTFFSRPFVWNQPRIIQITFHFVKVSVARAIKILVFDIVISADILIYFVKDTLAETFLDYDTYFA